MLDAWLVKNKLVSLSDIASPEQLEPFKILPLYTASNSKIIDIPYLPPKPFLANGEEYNDKQTFLVRLQESLKNASSLVYLYDDLDIDLSKLEGIDFSILKTFLSTKQWKPSYSKFTKESEDTAFYIENSVSTEEIPPYTSRGISAYKQVLSGCNKSQELAYTLFEFTKTLRHVDLNKIHFTFYNDNHFALDIAKIRAFRFLYLQILSHHNLPVVSPHIHIRVNPRIYTRNEAWMNVKRQGTAVFSGLVTNAQSISLIPFDFREPLKDIDSQRVSRNIINILKEESHLWDVYDPAKGSYLFETLTHDIAEAAWSIFQKLLLGNYDGENEILSVENKRIQLYKDKKLDLIGTTIYQSKDFNPAKDPKFIDGVLS